MEIEILPFKIQGAPWNKKLDQNMLKNIIV